jgi:hypothetical protein
LGEKCEVIYGEKYITDILCGVKVRLSPLSFYQVNRDMAEKLYEKACEYAKPEGKNILDLYCGAGTIGLSMAKKDKWRIFSLVTTAYIVLMAIFLLICPQYENLIAEKQTAFYMIAVSVAKQGAVTVQRKQELILSASGAEIVEIAVADDLRHGQQGKFGFQRFAVPPVVAEMDDLIRLFTLCRGKHRLYISVGVRKHKDFHLGTPFRSVCI